MYDARDDMAAGKVNKKKKKIRCKEYYILQKVIILSVFIPLLINFTEHNVMLQIFLKQYTYNF